MKKNGEEFNKMYGAIETNQKNIETNQKTINARLKAIEDSKDDIKQMMKKNREEFNRMYAKL